MKEPKAQSLIEYVITLTAIIMAIVAGTIGFQRGVQNGVDTYQHSVETTVTKNNPWARHNHFINNPEGVSRANPTARYNEYINNPETDTGGEPSNPNI